MKEKENYSILRDPVVKFFRGNNFAFLGTLNKDGSPQVTPTWIDIAEDRYELFTGHRTARNLYLYRKLGYREFKRLPVNDRIVLVFLEKYRKSVKVPCMRNLRVSALDISVMCLYPL